MDISDTTSILSLSVTEEQKQLLYQTWLLHEWPVEVVSEESGRSISTSGHCVKQQIEILCDSCGAFNVAQTTSHEGPAQTVNMDQASVNDDDDDDDNDNDDDIGFHVTQNDDEEECPSCLCMPCITNEGNSCGGRQQTHYLMQVTVPKGKIITEDSGLCFYTEGFGRIPDIYKQKLQLCQ